VPKLEKTEGNAMADLIETIEDGVAMLTLNRPDSLNAFSNEQQAALREALPRLGIDTSVGAIVITGAGRAFCAGGDVKGMGARSEMSYEHRVEALRTMHLLPQIMRTVPKVIIGMINGPAFGAGLGLAMACDLRIAGRSASFGTAFGKMAFSGDFGGSWFLTRLVGTQMARELYFLSDSVDAERAERIGLVSRVVDDAALHSETMAIAHRIAAGPRVAYGYMKRNLHAAETEPLSTVLEMEAVHQARTAQTDDHREARTAFVEKRRPVFTGR
jgi:2-(1,2-epoxy-1,2-dihydrophenyl)acetyl-CoA isomerase